MARGTPRSLCPPDTPDRGLLPPPPGLLVPRLLSPPLAACSCVCSMSGLLAKMQVGCSTTPRLAWVWKILLFPLPVSLLCVSEVSSSRKPSLTEPWIASSLGQGRGRGWISWLFRSPGLLHPLGAFSISHSVVSDSL